MEAANQNGRRHNSYGEKRDLHIAKYQRYKSENLEKEGGNIQGICLYHFFPANFGTFATFQCSFWGQEGVKLRIILQCGLMRGDKVAYLKTCTLFVTIVLETQ